MTEPTPQAVPAPVAPEPQTPAPAQAPEPTPTEPDWKAESRKWETRAKENKAKADQFSLLEEASKTDAQRLQDAAASAQKERDDAVAETLRLRVALKHGIGEDDFDLLGSGTEEQIEARAERIAAKNKAAAEVAAAAAVPNAPPPVGKTVADLKPGATPNPTPAVDDVAARHRQFFPHKYQTQ